MEYQCPVCGYAKLEDPPCDQEICPSCGTQFGYHDLNKSHASLRLQWVRNKMQWHSRAFRKPHNWSPVAQLKAAHLLGDEEIQAAWIAKLLRVSGASHTATTRGKYKKRDFSIVNSEVQPLHIVGVSFPVGNFSGSIMTL